ncbi:hypothetical protein AB9K41_17035, partial [Cribrihabitans sp. XS_ASV171]
SCRSLRDAAEIQAKRLGPPDILPRLEGMGYGNREIDEIRTCNAIFSDGNMPYLLMATLARLLLEGHAWQGQGSLEPRKSPIEGRAKPVLLEAHHADPTMASTYEDIRETLGLPFVNTDYRAF